MAKFSAFIDKKSTIKTAIVLAGGERKLQVIDRVKYFFQDLYYSESLVYSHGVYKPLDVHLVFVDSDRTETEVSLLEHKLRNLGKVGQVDEVVIVGNKREIEAKIDLSALQRTTGKKYLVIDQYGKIPDGAVDKLKARRIPRGSLAYNAIIGYVNSSAYREETAALFTMVDDPLTTTEEYELMLAQHREDAALVYPWVKEDILKPFKWRHRYYLRLFDPIQGNDQPHPLLERVAYEFFNHSKKRFPENRVGRRVSSMALANPSLAKNLGLINATYYARKVRDVPQLIWQFGKYALSFLWKYAVNFSLSMSDINDTANHLLGGNVYSYDLDIPLSTLDLDTNKDARAIIRTYNNLTHTGSYSFAYPDQMLYAVRFYDQLGRCFKEIV